MDDDWHVLGFSTDPTPGEPQDILQHGARMRLAADLAEAQQRRLQAVADNSVALNMQGDYAPKFQDRLSALSTTPANLTAAYQGGSQAMTAFAQSLEQAQSQSRSALADGTNAFEQRQQTSADLESVQQERAEIANLQAMGYSVNPEVDASLAEQEANLVRRANQLDEDLQGYRQSAINAMRDRAFAEVRCEQAIRDSIAKLDPKAFDAPAAKPAARENPSGGAKPAEKSGEPAQPTDPPPPTTGPSMSPGQPVGSQPPAEGPSSPPEESPPEALPYDPPVERRSGDELDGKVPGDRLPEGLPEESQPPGLGKPPKPPGSGDPVSEPDPTGEVPPEGDTRETLPTEGVPAGGEPLVEQPLGMPSMSPTGLGAVGPEAEPAVGGLGVSRPGGATVPGTATPEEPGAVVTPSGVASAGGADEEGGGEQFLAGQGMAPPIGTSSGRASGRRPGQDVPGDTELAPLITRELLRTAATDENAFHNAYPRVLADRGLTAADHDRLRSAPHTGRGDGELAELVAVRDRFPVRNQDVMTKVVSANVARMYLDNTTGSFDATRVVGLVVRGMDVAELITPAQLREGLGLDDSNSPTRWSPIPSGAKEAFQLRWFADQARDFRAAYGGPDEASASRMGWISGSPTSLVIAESFVGSGYVYQAGIPEYYVDTSMGDRAELWRITADGQEAIAGVYVEGRGWRRRGDA